MSIRITNQKLFYFIILLSMILVANFSLYRLDFAQPITPLVTFGSFLDFIFTIPLLTYLFFIRKRYSIKYIFPLVAVGYFSAWLLIPTQYFESISFSKYIIYVLESGFLLFELYIAVNLFRKLPNVIRQLRQGNQSIPFFNYNLETAITSQFKSSKMVNILVSELSVLYYSLFSYKKKINTANFEAFSYHHKTSTIALNIMLIHALVIESIGFHFLLHSWSPLISVVILILNIYGLFMLVAEIQAVRLCPYLLSEEILFIQTGLMKKIEIPLINILSFKEYKQPNQKEHNEEKILFDATPSDFIKEQPNFEIILSEPVTAKYLYGMTKQVRKVHFSVDQPQQFAKSLNNKLQSLDL